MKKSSTTKDGKIMTKKQRQGKAKKSSEARGKNHGKQLRREGVESLARASVDSGLEPAKAGTQAIAGFEHVVGLDLGDRKSHACVLSAATGEVVERIDLPTTAEGLSKSFETGRRMRIVMEAGTHSPWVSRTLEAFGHEVLVANPSRMVLGGKRRRKTDRFDAEQQARLGRVDPALLFPIRHRSAEAQADLARLRARDAVVRTRVDLINHMRGIVKATGTRLPSCSAEAFASKASAHIPPELADALGPILALIAEMTRTIRSFDREIERVARERYPETSLLTEINGVGALTALAFVLTLEDPNRFANSRDAGAYVGLVPYVHQSGNSDPELRISKAGNKFLRRLLVQSAHYILGPFGQDCDLRRFGERLHGRGGKGAKKRAVIGVARKLAVLMHRLWLRGEAYDPLYQAKKNEPSGDPSPRA